MTSGIKRPDSDYTRALAMRDAGMKYREIGEQFGVVTSRAWQMVERGYQLHRASSLTFASRSFPSWDDRGWGPRRPSAFNWLGGPRKPRLGEGDLTWQWREWNEWVATPMIGRSDDNTILAPPYG